MHQNLKKIFSNVTCVVLDMLVEVEGIKDVTKVDVAKGVGVVVLSKAVVVTKDVALVVVVVGVVESFIGSDDVDAVVVAIVVVGVVESFMGSDDIDAVVVVVVVVVVGNAVVVRLI